MEDLSSQQKRALEHVKLLVSMIHVPNKNKQHELKQVLGATFASGYLEGYFEGVDSKDFGTWYKDYSRTLGQLYSDAIINIPSNKARASVSGMTGSPGKSSGPVCIVEPNKIDTAFPAGGILVCTVTTPKYVPLMQKAAAIVTDQGGVLSHAAIVARELKVPCIVGTGNATKVLKDGQLVMVDASLGVVKAL